MDTERSILISCGNNFNFNMPYWVSTLILILVIYIVISIALYYLQDYVLFKPEKLSNDFRFDYENQKTKEYNLETRDGAEINGLRFFPKRRK
ncbi:hypothetical protein [Winogradskyella sp.]|uniref:hypothetical protein n=1 Tax=Winogradskyella sp. TaxID=1883156 RepID=UPI003F6C814A